MGKTKRKQTYENNKKEKIGTEITCPICGSKFIKKQYAQAFCNIKCKDTFWNAKKDRHTNGYYKKYDDKHPERKLRRALYSMNVHNSHDAEELNARMALVNDADFRQYVNDADDIGDIPPCYVDLATQYKNYLGIE